MGLTDFDNHILGDLPDEESIRSVKMAIIINTDKLSKESVYELTEWLNDHHFEWDFEDEGDFDPELLKGIDHE